MYLRFFVQDSHKNMEISDKTISISEDKLKKCKEIIPKTNKVIYINENHAVLSLCSYLEGDKKTAYDYIAYMLNYHRNSSVYELINKQIEHDRLEELPGMIEADPENNSLTVLFDEDREVVYEAGALSALEPAYCLSVHKSQGSEFPVVIMPVIGGPPMLLTRNLLYTALTRARSLVVLVGTEQIIRRMVENDHVIRRYTTLAARLVESRELVK